VKTCDSTGAIKRASKRATVVREKTASPCTPEWIGVWSRGCGRFGGGLEDHETAVRRAKTAFVCDCFANHLSCKVYLKAFCLHTRTHTHTHTHTHAILFVYTYLFLMCVCFVCYTSTHTHTALGVAGNFSYIHICFLCVFVLLFTHLRIHIHTWGVVRWEVFLGCTQIC